MNFLSDLSDKDVKVYLYYFSLCFKGRRIRSMREIKISGVAKSLQLSYSQVRQSVKKLVENGFLEKKTTTFQQNKLWTMASYFRLPTTKDKQHFWPIRKTTPDYRR